jgi:hypothetical protein
MVQRCTNPNNTDFPWYGNRGIKVCDDWRDYLTFKAWALSNGYSEDLTIERKNTDGDYSPNNCKWVTMTDQCNNRRSNRYLTFNGETLTVSEWCRKLNLNRNTVGTRLNRGWSVEKTLTT